MSAGELELVVTPPDRLVAGDLSFACVLGRSGVRTDKREGDGATPAGRFALRRVLYRADRRALPDTGLQVARIARDDGWCDDPADPAYNAQIRLPYAASHEKLWRHDGLYDIIAVLGYNDQPPVPGAGSAIFMHVARNDRRPTEGCIALAAVDLERVLTLCGPGTVVRIELNAAPLAGARKDLA